MLRPTDPQLENLMYLRDVVFPWMEAHPENVNFNGWACEDSCGTEACLVGWYGIMRYQLKPGGALNHWACDVVDGEEFGLGATWDELFGINPNQSLAERKARLNEIIEERTTALVTKAELESLDWHDSSVAMPVAGA